MVRRIRARTGQVGDEAVETAVRFVRSRPIIHTANAYARAILRYFEWCIDYPVHPWEAKHGHAGIFQASLHKLAPGTQRNYVIAARAFYRFAVIEEVVSRDPFVYVRIKTPDAVNPTPALTMEQLVAVLRPMHDRMKAGTASLVDRRDYTIIRLVARIGARLNSVREATWAGWASRGTDGVLTFAQKGGGGHSVVLQPEDAEVLLEWRDTLANILVRDPLPDEPIFPMIGAGRQSFRRGLRLMARSSLRDAVKARYLAVGLSGRRLAFHALRATSATISDESGASIREIQRTGGWKSPKMAELYIKRQSSTNALVRWSINLDDEPAA